MLLATNARHKRAWNDAHPLSDSKVGFQMYVPTKLPGNLSITAKRINIRHAKFYSSEKGNPESLATVSVEMNLRREDWVYDIGESRAGQDNASYTWTALRNYDPNSKEPTCIQRKSPSGQSYRLCHWTDYDRISVFEVNFNKKGTNIETTFPVTLDKPITSEDLDSYVDSFKKADSEGIPIQADAI